MTPEPRRVARLVAGAGQCVLIVMSIAWAVLERPAPLVNVRWREGLSEEARRDIEVRLFLENGEPADQAWRYELLSPRRADIAAIVRHPDVQDTHRIERESATLSDNAGYGTVRVWWAGPFKGVRGGVQFRAMFLVIGVVTLVGASLASGHRWRFARGLRRRAHE